MNVLVVHSHPDPESFGAAVRDAALRGLEQGGHDVTLLDLEAEGYDPCLTEADLLGIQPDVRRHLDVVAAADVLIFTYPTFWSGLPAMLKGWIDRTMPPDAEFAESVDDRPRGDLGHIRQIVGVTTYGSPRSYRWVVGDGGRRTLRQLRWSAGVRCRLRWLALDRLDGRTHDERSAFLDEVEQSMAALAAGRR